MADNYVYRCIGISAQRANNANTDQVAASVLYGHIEHQMREGFEFHGSHVIHTWRSPGCLGALLGQGNSLFATTVLVFRRHA